ncbi:MAG: carbohydrate porin [Planctomycetota bacterium]|jgi:porin
MRSLTSKKNIVFTILSLLLILTFVNNSFGASDQSPEKLNRSNLGGPDAVENQMKTDRAEKDSLFDFRFFEPYFGWKSSLQEDYGISFGGDYTFVYLKSSDSLKGTEDEASGGMYRLFGSWELLGRGTETTGTIIYKVEHRHRYGDTAPSGFSLGNLGNVGVIEPPFSNQGWRLTNLYWKQSWHQGQVVALAGFLDATDYVDVFALGSPWNHFMNFVFSTGSAAISLPEDATLGAAVATWLNDEVYIIAGLEDTNSDPTDPFEGFNTFVNDNEYLKHIEIGRTTSKDRAYLDNVHVTFWQVDERKAAGVEDGWGAALSWSHFVSDKWMPFVRAGFAEDGGSLLENSVSAGVGYRPKTAGTTPGDLLGVAVNWGQPNETVFGPGLDDQYTAEVFYRIQLTKEIAITPDVQLLFNPALNPDEDMITVFGLRTRMAF